MPDDRSQAREIPFNGKLMTGEPAAIGLNFRTLKNYEYTDTHIRGIRGMTELGGVSNADTDDWGDSDDFGNSDDWGQGGTYYETKNAFHFTKSQPAETHLLAQKFSSSGTLSGILDATAAIPTSANFSATVILSNSGTNTGYFCNAPDGYLIFANGADTHIWGGTEAKCDAFISSEAAVTTAATNPMDYTAAVTNTKTDTEYLATIAATATTFLVGSSLPLQGIKLYSYTANTAVAGMSGRYWNGSAWTSMTITDSTSNPSYAETFADAMATTGAWTASGVALTSTSGGQSGNCLSIAATASASGGCYHDIATVVGQAYRFSGYFKKGTSSTGQITIGTTATAAGYWDSTALSDADWTAYTTSFIAAATAARITLRTNDDTAGETSLFDTIQVITGKTLAQTGTVTWSSTVATAKPLYLESYFLYWYQFSVTSGCSAQVYHCTTDAPFQPIVDLWDGVYRVPLRFFKKTTSYLDNTINVMQDDYYVSDTTTYSDLSSLGAYSAGNNCLEIGFEEKQTGIYFNVAPDYTNSTASTTAAVDYWDGAAYTSAGTCVDGTAEGGIAFAKPGTISWNSNAITDETVKVVANSPPLYYYRVRFDEAMDSSVRLNYVGGVAAQVQLSDYRFPVFAQGRVLLCNDQSEAKNSLICSSKWMPQVYNGSDSVIIYFGDESELTCGTELFSLFGSSLYSLVLMFKDNETWVMTGADIDAWADNTFLLSSSIGCPAPLTLKTVNLSAEPGAGVNRALAMWQGTNGIFMSDGRAPIPVHGDISAYFDPQDSRCITASHIGDSVAEIDPVNQHYHWLFYSGTAATAINKHLVYDIKRNRWFEVDMGGKVLNFICRVHDTDGNPYVYGFRSNGKVYRMNYGATFDGEDITHTWHTGAFPLGGLTVDTQVDRWRLIAKSRTAGSDAMTVTHYGDENEVGTDKTHAMYDSERSVVQTVKTDKLHGNSLHAWKGVTTTHDETTGPEPLALAVTYHPTHKD